MQKAGHPFIFQADTHECNQARVAAAIGRQAIIQCYCVVAQCERRVSRVAVGASASFCKRPEVPVATLKCEVGFFFFRVRLGR